MPKNALKTPVFGRLGSQSGRFGSKNGHLGSKSGRLRFVFGHLGAESGRFGFKNGHLERVWKASGTRFCKKNIFYCKKTIFSTKNSISSIFFNQNFDFLSFFI